MQYCMEWQDVPWLQYTYIGWDVEGRDDARSIDVWWVNSHILDGIMQYVSSSSLMPNVNTISNQQWQWRTEEVALYWSNNKWHAGAVSIVVKQLRWPTSSQKITLNLYAG